MVHDWGSRDAEFLRINRMVLDKIVELAGGQGTHVTVPVQGSGTFAVEAMITTLRAEDRQAAGADQRRLRPARAQDRPDRRPRHGVARDAGGHAARPGAARPHARRRQGDQPRLRRPLRDDVGHPQSHRRGGGDRRAARPPPAGRFHERLRRARDRRRARSATTRWPRPPTSAWKACRAWASWSAATRRWPSARATPRRWCSTCSTRPRPSPAPASTASRRPSTSSWRWARRSRSTRPKAASPAAASAIARMPGC